MDKSLIRCQVIKHYKRNLNISLVKFRNKIIVLCDYLCIKCIFSAVIFILKSVPITQQSERQIVTGFLNAQILQTVIQKTCGIGEDTLKPLVVSCTGMLRTFLGIEDIHAVGKCRLTTVNFLKSTESFVSL